MIGDSLPENLRIARESDVSTELASLETELNARLDGAATKIAGIEEQAKTFATAEALSETTDASQAARDELSRDRAKTETTLRNEIDVVGETMNKVTGQLSDRYDEQLKELNSIRDQVSILATATAANRVQEGAEGGDEISPGTLARLALLEGRIRQLQGQLDAMPEQLAAAPDFSRLDLLEKRVTELENKPTVKAAEQAAAGVAISALSQAVTGSGPFRSELDLVTKVTGLAAPAELDALADKGLPSSVSLADRYALLARRARREHSAAERAAAAEAAGEDSGGVGGWLSSFVTVTSEGDLEGDSVPAVLSRAGENVKAGDLGGALSELETLPEPAAAVMAEWVTDAEARVGAEAALNRLQTELLSTQ